MSPNKPVDHPVRRWEIWLAVLLVAVMAGWLGWVVLDSRTEARKANSSVSDLSSALDRRAPTLEYMDCRDRAELPFEAAQAEYLLAAVDLGEAGRADPPDPQQLAQAEENRDRARARYEEARLQLLAVNDPTKPLEGQARPGEPHRCPALPQPGG